jgi:hypothetical protein
MARHRLAAKAIEFGDKDQFAILMKGLRSKNAYDRSDAAGFLADVAADMPEKLKPKAIKLLKSGKKRDHGGITADAFDKALRKLEGK